MWKKTKAELPNSFKPLSKIDLRLKEIKAANSSQDFGSMRVYLRVIWSRKEARWRRRSFLLAVLLFEVAEDGLYSECLRLFIEKYDKTKIIIILSDIWSVIDKPGKPQLLNTQIAHKSAQNDKRL